MAYGIELILGWRFKDWNRLTDVKLPPYQAVRHRSPFQIALPYEAEEGEDPDELDPDGDSDPGSVYDAFKPALEVFNAALDEAHRRALVEMGFVVKSKTRGNYTKAATPLGDREFVPFRLNLYYDPHEMGDDADSAIIGISITGRYFPTFADWMDSSGAMSPMVFDDELQKAMGIAKRHIVSVLPCLAEAPWLVKEIHY